MPHTSRPFDRVLVRSMAGCGGSTTQVALGRLAIDRSNRGAHSSSVGRRGGQIPTAAHLSTQSSRLHAFRLVLTRKRWSMCSAERKARENNGKHSRDDRGSQQSPVLLRRRSRAHQTRSALLPPRRRFLAPDGRTRPCRRDQLPRLPPSIPSRRMARRKRAQRPAMALPHVRTPRRWENTLMEPLAREKLQLAQRLLDEILAGSRAWRRSGDHSSERPRSAHVA